MWWFLISREPRSVSVLKGMTESGSTKSESMSLSMIGLAFWLWLGAMCTEDSTGIRRLSKDIGIDSELNHGPSRTIRGDHAPPLVSSDLSIPNPASRLAGGQ